MDPQEMLDQANEKVRDRFTFHLYVWRRIRNRCPQCGSRMLVRHDNYGKIRNCSVYPNHRPYEVGLNVTFSLYVIIFILMAIIYTGSCQKPANKKDIRPQTPQMIPVDTHNSPYLKER